MNDAIKNVKERLAQDRAYIFSLGLQERMIDSESGSVTYKSHINQVSHLPGADEISM